MGLGKDSEDVSGDLIPKSYPKLKDNCTCIVSKCLKQRCIIHADTIVYDTDLDKVRCILNALLCIHCMS